MSANVKWIYISNENTHQKQSNDAMFEINRKNEAESMKVLRIFLLTALQMWYYCGHVLRVRTIKFQKFNCQFNLINSHKVWGLNYRPF